MRSWGGAPPAVSLPTEPYTGLQHPPHLSALEQEAFLAPHSDQGGALVTYEANMLRAGQQAAPNANLHEVAAGGMPLHEQQGKAGRGRQHCP